MENKIKALLLAVQKDNFAEVQTQLKELERFYGEDNPKKSELISHLRRSNSGDSALHVAAQHGRINILKYFVEEYGVPVDLRNHDRKTPLHDAAQFSQLECAEYLLQKGADVNAVKKADWTPLMLACTKLNVEMIAMLLKYGAEPLFKNKDGWKSFHIASREGSVEILELLVDSLPDPSPESIQQLVNTRSRNGRKPLHTAALHGHLAVVEYLVRKRFTSLDDEDNCGTTPLMDAVRSGSTQIVDLLIRNGANKMSVNKTGYNCLHVAAEAGIAHMIVYLVQQYGFDVEESIRDGSLTALQIAIKEKQHAVENAIKNLQSAGDVKKNSV